MIPGGSGSALLGGHGEGGKAGDNNKEGQASSSSYDTADEGWNEARVWRPSSTFTDTDAKKPNADHLIDDTKQSAPAESITPSPPITKRVHFSDNEDSTIEYEMSPQDLRNSWHSTNIPRTLVNLGRISQIHGMVASYPKSSVERGIECMIRIEPSPIIFQIDKIKDEHRKAVLAEQRRQQMDGVEVDAEKLCAVAAKQSERSVEIAKSSWWLDRMNYRSFV